MPRDLAGASLDAAVSLGMMALLGPVHTLLASAFLVRHRRRL